jgi:hypothetical protein
MVHSNSSARTHCTQCTHISVRPAARRLLGVALCYNITGCTAGTNGTLNMLSESMEHLSIRDNTIHENAILERTPQLENAIVERAQLPLEQLGGRIKSSSNGQIKSSSKGHGSSPNNHRSSHKSSSKKNVANVSRNSSSRRLLPLVPTYFAQNENQNLLQSHTPAQHVKTIPRERVVQKTSPKDVSSLPEEHSGFGSDDGAELEAQIALPTFDNNGNNDGVEFEGNDVVKSIKDLLQPYTIKGMRVTNGELLVLTSIHNK